MRHPVVALLAVLLASAVALETRAAAAEGAPEEPAVRIPVQKGDKIEPIRHGKRIVAVRVTPPRGRPYYLVDPDGTGNWLRRSALDWALAVPLFLLFEFD